ncbi:hypothetical protein DSO57_1011719 [Entomophthora muscae]|uniref:Uncharacterized protein n=1 Tax=Entomophthora muscae TaxID=34485 RepID=A0ACC2T611_9FUNG|nr:hypothetical protein DSO57_1011719 [Entomophthora muscae]
MPLCHPLAALWLSPYKAPNILEISEIIFPTLKFVVFSLASVLLLVWKTFPDLWCQISSSVCLVGDDSSRLLYLPNELLSSGEILARSLTCGDLDLYYPDLDLNTPFFKKTLVPPFPQLEEKFSGPQQTSKVLERVPTVKLHLPLGPPLQSLQNAWGSLSNYVQNIIQKIY